MPDNSLRERDIALGLLSDYIRRNSMRATSERNLIFSTMFDMPQFFDVQTLHSAVVERLNVSLATIYSTLELFQECGIIIRHNFSSKMIRYERANFSQEGAYYKICIGCHKIKKFKDSKLSKSIMIRNSESFSSIRHTLYMYGYCRKCQTKRIAK